MVQPRKTGTGQRLGTFKVSGVEIVPSKFDGKDQVKLTLADIGELTEKHPKLWKDQFEWFTLSNAEESAFWDFVKQLIRLRVISATAVDATKDVEELAELLCNKVVGYELAMSEQRIGRKTNPSWFPDSVVKEPTKKK